jgi:hypothetical protein
MLAALKRKDGPGLVRLLEAGMYKAQETCVGNMKGIE